MAYHGLLDWRLAADLLGLMQGRGFEPNRLWGKLGSEVVGDFAEQFDGFELRDMGGLPAAVHPARCVLGLHPLEESSLSYASERVAEAAVEASSEGYEDAGQRQVKFADYFDLLRRPGHVYSRLWE